MADRNPVVSSHGQIAGISTEKAAAWKRVSRRIAFSVTVVGGAAFFVDGGFPAGKAIAVGLALGLLTYLLMSAVGAVGGLGSFAGFSDPKNRVRIARGFGLFCGFLGGSGVYFHDGAPLTDALATGAALGVFGFVIGYFPIIAFILSIIGLGA